MDGNRSIYTFSFDKIAVNLRDFRGTLRERERERERERFHHSELQVNIFVYRQRK